MLSPIGTPRKNYNRRKRGARSKAVIGMSFDQNVKVNKVDMQYLSEVSINYDSIKIPSCN